MGRNDAGGGPRLRGDGSTTYGYGEGLDSNKEAPAWALESGVQAGRETPWPLPYKPLSHTTRRLEDRWYMVLLGRERLNKVRREEREPLAFSIPRGLPSELRQGKEKGLKGSNARYRKEWGRGCFSFH